MLPGQPEPAVVTAMRGFKRDLLARETGRMQEMARRWLEVEQALEAEIDALAMEVSMLADAGEVISDSKLFRLRRYRRLLAQTQVEIGGYAAWADGFISQGQKEMLELGIWHATQAIQLAGQGMGTFDRLPIEAVESMAGMAGDGKPVGELLRRRMVYGGPGGPGGQPQGLPLPGVLERLQRTLVQATALGWNPRKTARMMRDDLAGGLQKALTIARSEQMRVYREASRQQYEKSNVVLGQKRLAAHDGRTCAACLADEGTLYSVKETIPDHPQGRCTGVPVVKGQPEITWLGGEKWLKTQPVEVQRQVLGQGKLEAWQDGQIEFSKLAQRTTDAVWGDGIRPVGLKELT